MSADHLLLPDADWARLAEKRGVEDSPEFRAAFTADMVLVFQRVADAYRPFVAAMVDFVTNVSAAFEQAGVREDYELAAPSAEGS